MLQFTDGGQIVLLQSKLYFSNDPEGVKHFPGGGGGSNFFMGDANFYRNPCNL